MLQSHENVRNKNTQRNVTKKITKKKKKFQINEKWRKKAGNKTN